MAKLDLVSLGEPMYEFSQVPGQQRQYLQGYGGDTMNCAIAAARQGAKVSFITRLGDDEFGREFLELWKKERIDTSGVGIDANAHTAVYFIRHGPQGHVFSYLRKGSAASRITPEHLSQDLIQSARYFHSSGITQAISTSACDTVFAAIDLARRGGVKVAFDANIRPRLWPADRAREIVAKTIPLTDCFLLSLEDAELLGAPKDRSEIVRWAHDLGARNVVLKLGPEGILASDHEAVYLIPGHQVTSVDATGAGDCCAGALLARLSLGDDFLAALRYANAAAALTTTGYGAVAPLPTADIVFEFLKISSPSK
jgi:2-dehydro-3-deoxygluconokinase